MKHTLRKPTDCQEAIRAARYVNACDLRALWEKIGGSYSYLSEVQSGKKRGSFRLMDRILEQIKGVEWL